MTDGLMDRLSEYVDGTLEPEARARVEAWLRTSADGREVVVDLERVKRRAADLKARSVPESVWLGVLAEIRVPGRRGAEAQGRRDAETQGRRGAETQGRRGAEAQGRRGAGGEKSPRWIAFSVPQLAVAAALLVVAGGTGGWWLVRGRTQPNVASANPIPVRSDSSAAAGTRLVVNGAKADQTYDRAINDLQRVVSANRRQLRPETIRVIRENLARIDSALTRAEQALEQDPHNPYLYDHMTEMRQRKLDLLRRTANLASAS